jgi:DNA-nicking Smr family endonuclease
VDFGDILDEWDRQTSKAPGKKEVARKRRFPPGTEEKTASPEGKHRVLSGGDFLKKTDPLTAWLRANGVYDKDAAEEAPRVSSGERHRRLLAKRPDGVIDLHGLNQDEAWNSLESFFQEGRRRGFEKILIIHGKGNHSIQEGVLKETVRKFIERCPFAGESGHENAALGGTGATWVLLKNIL